MHRVEAAKAGRWAVVLMAGASLAACASLTTPKYDIHAAQSRAPANAPRPGGPRAGGKGTDQPYQVGGIWYAPHDQPNYDEKGIASWYGDAFNMKATADGEVFDMDQLSAAHTTLPLPSMVEVTNLDNGRKLNVRVNDRGPFVGGRIIDLSRAAAQELGYDRAGTAHVRVRYLGPAPLAGPGAGVRYAKASPPAARGAMSTRRPADEEIFDEAAVTPVSAPRPLVPRREAISVAQLAPLPSTHLTQSDVPTGALGPGPQGSAAQVYRIQAGAFSDQDNARRAAAQLAGAGSATIEPMERGGVTLYRVILPGPADEAEAFAMRDRVAGIGFADARVLRP
ncbi:MAG TPA: septal ring lytic transglycosylase RlpA family protein [Phenylobacterium sp.]|nr:septal ring lytic transglycosylase RlpA family protein [Phenylobacterium sp.]